MPSAEWEKIAAGMVGGTRLQVKITPGASRTKILGPHGNCLKIAVNAPPEKGKANHALIEFLAEVLGVPRSRIALQSGMTSPRKTLFVQRVTPAECLSRLQEHSV
jgi:uncharacterized protein